MHHDSAVATHESQTQCARDLKSLAWLLITSAALLTILQLLLLSHNLNKSGLHKQNLILGIASASLLLGLLGLWGPLRYRPACRTFPLILAGTALLFIGAITWNRVFIQHYNHTTYRGEIFRKANYNVHAPLYGRPAKHRNLRAAIPPAALALGLGCWLAWRPRQRLRSRWLLWQLIVFQIAMTTLLGYYSVKARKATIAEDVGRTATRTESRTFNGPGDLLQRYVSMMPHLSMKARHYPPGSALLWQFELTYGPRHLALALALLLPALALLPLKGICTELGFSAEQTAAAMLLYTTGATILVFPAISLMCMTVFLLAMCIWLLVRALKRNETWAAMLLGFFFATYMFCTFATYMVAIFMGLLTIAALCCRLVSLWRVLKVLIISISVYVACFWLLYLISGFNIIACFRMALHLHLEQTGVGFSGFSRYLLRSTGGILAYLISAGLPLSILAYASVAGFFRDKQASRWTGVFCLSLTAAIILSGFSGMSFMETERIWLFFSLPLAAAAGFELGRRIEHEGHLAVTGAICLALLQACCYGLFYEQMLGRLPADPQTPSISATE